jgi:hypothetical protein
MGKNRRHPFLTSGAFWCRSGLAGVVGPQITFHDERQPIGMRDRVADLLGQLDSAGVARPGEAGRSMTGLLSRLNATIGGVC